MAELRAGFVRDEMGESEEKIAPIGRIRVTEKPGESSFAIAAFLKLLDERLAAHLDEE